jgi:hypothetical protein
MRKLRGKPVPRHCMPCHVGELVAASENQLGFTGLSFCDAFSFAISLAMKAPN